MPETILRNAAELTVLDRKKSVVRSYYVDPIVVETVNYILLNDHYPNFSGIEIVFYCFDRVWKRGCSQILENGDVPKTSTKKKIKKPDANLQVNNLVCSEDHQAL